MGNCEEAVRLKASVGVGSMEERDGYLGCGEPLMGFWPYLRQE